MPSGPGISDVYDGFGRLLSTSTHLDGATPAPPYQYEPNRHPPRSTDRAGAPRPLAYQYGPNGNRLRITHPDGHWFGALYDALNRQFYLFGEGEAPLVYSEYAAHGALALTGRPASPT